WRPAGTGSPARRPRWRTAGAGRRAGPGAATRRRARPRTRRGPPVSPLTGLPGSVVVRHTVRVAVDMTADYATVGRLVSGEAVELDVRVARIGSRVLAFLLDLMIKAVLGLILFN